MNKYMREALWEAYEGISRKDGGPFGCVIVKDGEIVGKGHNEVLRRSDCTCHGEIMAIRDACYRLNTHDLAGCELYTTAEPCPMCKGAIQWANIKKVYAGCNTSDVELIGFRDKILYESDIDIETLERQKCIELFMTYAAEENKRY